MVRIVRLGLVATGASGTLAIFLRGGTEPWGGDFYADRMNEFFGLPAHPLIVHLPVVLIPLALVGVVLMIIRPTWWSRYEWATLVICGIGALGAVLAANSGEGLEEAVENDAVRSLLREHVEAGESARNMALLFFVVVLVVVLLPRWTAGRSLPKWWKPVAAAAMIVSGVLASATIYDAGHSGAKSVWNDVKVQGESD